MDGKVTWVEGRQMRCDSGSGHSMTFCGNAVTGPSPMEVVLMAVGACSMVDVVDGLRSHEVTGVDVALEGGRSEEPPRVFTSVNMKWTVEGAGVPRRQVERLIQLSHDKYCSVGSMVGQTAEITWSLELVDTSGDE